MKIRRKLTLGTLSTLRQRPGIRRLVLQFFVWLHNASYHMIAFFASHTGRHPKHDILRYHEFFLNHLTPNQSVLDIGCGKGEVTSAVVKKAKRVVGIDISPINIARARQANNSPRTNFIIGDATTYDFPEPFDVIILSNVLEHIADRPRFLRKLKKIAPRILIRVPMITRDWISVYKKNEGFEYRLDNTHYIEYDRDSFQQEIVSAGLQIRSLEVNFGELYAVVERQK